MPLEYIYARKNLAGAGVVILSELSTCSTLLNGSLKVNPFSALDVADAVEKGLSMSQKDQNYRRQRDLLFVSSHPSALWTKNILNDIQQLSTSPKKYDESKYLPSYLDCDNIKNIYDNVDKSGGLGTRLLIFDYGGTLLHKEKYDIYIKQTLSAISGRKPTEEVMLALKRLSEDPKNIVLVVTGLTKLKLGDTFYGMKNISLATTNGLVYSWGENLTKLYGIANQFSAFEEQKGGGQYDLLDNEDRHWEFLQTNVDWPEVYSVYTSIYMLYTYIHTYIHTGYIHIYIHTYIHTYINICIHTYIHTYIHMHTYIRIFFYIHSYIYPCIHTSIHTYMHVYIHI